jgi:hypothetical protein
VSWRATTSPNASAFGGPTGGLELTPKRMVRVNPVRLVVLGLFFLQTDSFRVPNANRLVKKYEKTR